MSSFELFFASVVSMRLHPGHKLEWPLSKADIVDCARVAELMVELCGIRDRHLAEDVLRRGRSS